MLLHLLEVGGQRFHPPLEKLPVRPAAILRLIAWPMGPRIFTAVQPMIPRIGIEPSRMTRSCPTEGPSDCSIMSLLNPLGEGCPVAVTAYGGTFQFVS